MKVEVHIEQMVLDRGATSNSELIASMLQRDLERQIAERRFWTTLRKEADAARVDWGSIAAEPSTSVNSIRTGIVKSIIGTMTYD